MVPEIGAWAEFCSDDGARSLSDFGGVAEQTYYRWRKEYGGLKVEQARRFKELERESLRPVHQRADCDAAAGSHHQL